MSIRGTAAAFASMDLFYVSVGGVSAVYLLDAELTFALCIVRRPSTRAKECDTWSGLTSRDDALQRPQLDEG